jgi:O-glycosyl hydrolase
MIRKLWLLLGTLGLALLFAMVFTACPPPEEDNGEETEIIDPYAAEKPVILEQSASKRYLSGSSFTIAPLSVTVKAVGDGGTLTYQWYSVAASAGEDDELLEGKTTTTFQPPTISAGTEVYYLEITNTKRTIDEEKGIDETRTATTVSAPISVIVLSSLPGTDATITVTTTPNQYVRGFGGMSNAFDINPPGVARYMQMQDIITMFGPDGLGLKILRIQIWPYPLDQVTSGQIDPHMGNGSTYLQAVRYVNNNGGYVLASPWTAPAHYKENGSLNAGGHLKTNMYADYANYLRNFAADMAAANAPIYAISIQNEPSLVVGYWGMEWTPTEHRNFLKNNGTFTRSPTSIAGYGGGKAQDFVKVASAEAHQVGGWYNEAMDAVIADTQAYANMDIAAYHIYGGVGNRAQVTRSGNLNKETWMTEYNINSQNEVGYYQDSSWNFVWVFADTIHQTIALNDSSGFVWWYLKRFYGVIGDGAYGTVNGRVMPRGYVLSHYAKYATDTVRVDATTTHTGNVSLSAFQRKSTKTTAVEQQVMANEDSYSVVVFDKRTTVSPPTPTTLRINLPAGFVASKVYGIISDPDKRHDPLEVILNPDGNSADITLPINAIVSVKFVK